MTFDVWNLKFVTRDGWSETILLKTGRGGHTSDFGTPRSCLSDRGERKVSDWHSGADSSLRGPDLPAKGVRVVIGKFNTPSMQRILDVDRDTHQRCLDFEAIVLYSSLEPTAKPTLHYLYPHLSLSGQFFPHLDSFCQPQV